jgi:multisubunit Na+/H+ antiporter MnhG subunit
VIIFLFMTAPVSAHLVAHAALRSRVESVSAGLPAEEGAEAEEPGN